MLTSGMFEGLDLVYLTKISKEKSLRIRVSVILSSLNPFFFNNTKKLTILA